jgi:hypothetical protein
VVYLIHFDSPLKHAQHFEKHKSGSGANILRAANEANITWPVVRVWEDGDRTFERKLKNQKKSSCM